MNIPLVPKVSKVVDAMMKTGEYESPADVVHAAILLLDADRRERKKARREIIKSVKLGFDQIARGEFHVGDEAFKRRVKSDGRRRLAAARRKAS